ncbi:Zinc finger RING-type [Trinorchestia longiramus]|nr:Zinc finger RING-type [Trinorchestia longiramus]
MNFYTFTAAALLGLLLMVCGSQCLAEVVVVDRLLNKTMDVMADMPSTFGPELSILGLKGLLAISNPAQACWHPIAGPPKYPPHVSPAFSHWIVLIDRGNCTFYEKVYQAQIANYSAVIVMNIGSDFIEPMGADDGDNITIPSVFIGQTDGEALKILFSDVKRIGIILTADLPDIESYLLPFAITVAVCFVGMLLCMVSVCMLLCMIVKCIRDYRRSMRHRLSWRALRRLPLHKFKGGVDPYDMCAICLDDYLDGDKLRILPCNHAYHSRCIDPWLTKRRRVCPVCKQKVRTPGERVEDSEEEDLDPDTERAPLLQQATQVSAGTFTNSRENPFMRANRRAQEAHVRRPDRSEYGRLSDDNDSDEAAAVADVSRRGSADSDTPGAGVTPVAGVTPGAGVASGAGVADTAVMLPAEHECLDDQLDVVSVTRSMKKKKKKTKKTKDKTGEEHGGQEGDDEGSVVVQVDLPAPPADEKSEEDSTVPPHEHPVV